MQKLVRRRDWDGLGDAGVLEKLLGPEGAQKKRRGSGPPGLIRQSAHRLKHVAAFVLVQFAVELAADQELAASDSRHRDDGGVERFEQVDVMTVQLDSNLAAKRWLIATDQTNATRRNIADDAS